MPDGKTGSSGARFRRAVQTLDERDVAVLDSQQARGSLDVGGAVAEAKCPVVADAALTPLVNPATRIAAEVDTGGGIADREQRTGYDRAL